MTFRHCSTTLRHDEEAAFELYDGANCRYVFAQYSRYNGCYNCEVVEFDYDDLDESDEPKPVLDSALLTDSDLGDCEVEAVHGGVATIEAAKAKFKEWAGV